MKINELLGSFEIFVTNEEKELLERVEGLQSIDCYNEREKFVIENLIKKSLITKVVRNNSYMVMKNE